MLGKQSHGFLPDCVRKVKDTGWKDDTRCLASANMELSSSGMGGVQGPEFGVGEKRH